MLIRVTAEILDTNEAVAAVESPAAGAVNVFLGVVRNNNLGRSVQYLEYDAYPAMAEKVMRELADAAKERFGLEDVAVLHRTGRLEIGEASLLIAVSCGAAPKRSRHVLVGVSPRVGRLAAKVVVIRTVRGI